MSAVTKFEELVGKGLSLIEFSAALRRLHVTPCTSFDFPTDGMDNVRDYGAIPFFSWASQATPRPRGDLDQPDFQLADIIAGSYDSYIREFAEAARNWGHPFFLRFDWEMNGNWFPWAEARQRQHPGRLRRRLAPRARHLHRGRRHQRDLGLVPLRRRRPASFADLAPLYPGDEYVDWTCLDGFNWGSNPANPQPWRSFDEIFAPTYRSSSSRSPRASR